MDSSAMLLSTPYYGPFQMSTFTCAEFKTDKEYSFAFFSEHVKLHTLKG